MRRFFTLLLILVCLACTQSEKTIGDPTQLIPRNASTIIKTNDVAGLLSAAKNNAFLKIYQDAGVLDAFKNLDQIDDYLADTSQVLICFTEVGKGEFETFVITSENKTLGKDTTPTTTTAFGQIEALDTTNNSLYSTKLDGFVLLSTSELLLENAVRELNAPAQLDVSLQKLMEITNADALATVFIKGAEMPALYKATLPNQQTNTLDNAFDWLSADIDLRQNDIKFSGVLLTKETNTLHSFSNTRPLSNKIAAVTPLNAKKVTAISIDNWKAYRTNLARMKGQDPLQWSWRNEAIPSLFYEIGIISMDTTKVMAAFPEDIILARETLDYSSEAGDFRSIDIYTFTEQGTFAKAFNSIVPFPSFTEFVEMEDYYLFAESRSALEKVIANIQNGSVMSKDPSFDEVFSHMSTASSYLEIINLQQGGLTPLMNKSIGQSIDKKLPDSYRYATVQLIQEANFMHLNGIVHQNEAVNSLGTITQEARVLLEAPVSRAPQLVRNHRTKGSDVVVQDQNNTLYLISNTGKMLWQKKLDGQILGKIQQVDLYRNGRLQLAFTTADQFYIIDRNGANVNPFPIQHKGKATLPLAIFDYEGSRNYRFVITQGATVEMYDRDAKLVKGFTYKEAKSPILFPPQHIRIKNKDYILIAQNNQSVAILNRTGQPRVTVSNTIDFGDTPFFEHDDQFRVYDVNGNLITITQKGTFAKDATEHNSNTKLTVGKNDPLFLNDNVLSWATKKISLPYGNYQKPEVFAVGTKKYVTITNQETSEVYILDSKLSILPNFPVYGNTTPEIAFLERNKALGFVTRGEANSVIIYKIN